MISGTCIRGNGKRLAALVVLLGISSLVVDGAVNAAPKPADATPAAANQPAAAPAAAPSELLAAASNEEASYRLIEEAAHLKQATGARLLLMGHDLLPLTPEQVVAKVIQNSLPLAEQQYVLAEADHAISAAKSAFDPKVTTSLSNQLASSNMRSQWITRPWPKVPNWQKVCTNLIDGSIVDNPTDADLNGQNPTVKCEVQDTTNMGCANINGAIQNPGADGCGYPLEIRTVAELASNRSPDWQKYYSGAIGASKAFDWGQNLQVNLNTNFNQSDWTRGVAVGYAGRAYGLPKTEWSSSLSTNFNTPVPYAKNFGETGNLPKVQENLAGINRQQADFNRQVLANSLIQTALNTYWEMVRATMQITTAMENRKLLEVQAAHVKRMMDTGGKATNYDLIQSQTQVANAENQEEIAWNNLVSQANTLAEQLTMPPKQLPMPKGYLKALLKDEPLPAPKAAKAKAMDNRPEIKASGLSVKAQELQLDYSTNQLKPDLSFSASYYLGETNSPQFAYGSFGSSLAGLGNPDNRNYYLGIQFRYPFGNEAVKSQHAQAVSRRDQSLDQQHLTELQVVQDVNNALSSGNSTHSQVQLARVNVGLANEAYDRASAMWAAGALTDFELLQRNQERYDARTSLINAMISQRQARVNLQAAQGELGQMADSAPVASSK